MAEFSESSIYEVCLLHSKSDRLLRLAVNKELEPYNITMMQWLLLVTVNNGASAGVRMTELSEKLNVTMPQITALMNDLVKQKLAKQKINSSDRRSRRLSITSYGKKQLAEIDDKVTGALESWFKSIPDFNLESYISLLKKLSEIDMPDTVVS